MLKPRRNARRRHH
uniref:Uncharacterized protein n=1 Tax=Arundo donax TaxID=35708 RepID=A0A0A9AZX0_ARUDO